MKTIGLLGGMSWESTSLYYQLLNKMVSQKLGGLHSAPIYLHSFNFEPLAKLLHDNKWSTLETIFTDAIKNLEKSGVDGFAICTNTMHKLANNLKKKTALPLLHLADGIGQSIQKNSLKKVGLLGTKFTLEENFIPAYLLEHYQIETILPPQAATHFINEVIFTELCQGKVVASSKKRIVALMETMKKNGSEGIILGCTEFSLMLKKNDLSIPLFDTVESHVRMIFDWMVN